MYGNGDLSLDEFKEEYLGAVSYTHLVCLDDDAVVITKDFFAKIYSEMKKHDAVAAALKIYDCLLYTSRCV